MALQGTLETFALPDVLRLLDTTKNTGCLALSSDLGTGSIHLVDGAIVAAESTRVAEHRDTVDVVFDLLRFAEGTFAFEDDVPTPPGGSPVDVDEVLSEAESMLEEWREIEKVVPSLDHWVTLAQDLPSHEVIVSSARWRTIAAVGGGRTVRGVGDSLDLGEVDVSRTVKDLVESGLAVMGEDVSARTVSDRLSSLAEADEMSSNGSHPVDAAIVEPAPEPAPEAAVVVDPDDSSPGFDPGELESQMSSNGADLDNVVSLDPSANGTNGSHSDPLANAGISADDAFLADVFPGLAARNNDSEGGEPAAAGADFPPPTAEAVGGVDLEDVSDEDLARQLANLSPRAAAAVQTAAQASTVEERDAALDEVDEDDEDINRGLLLKFLGSVNN